MATVARTGAPASFGPAEAAIALEHINEAVMAIAINDLI
jgi:hypothetical protein